MLSRFRNPRRFFILAFVYNPLVLFATRDFGMLHVRAKIGYPTRVEHFTNAILNYTCFLRLLRDF